MSAVTGTVTACTMRRMASIISRRSSFWPSGRPCAHATPALVLAIAGAPASSITRALAASQAFGNTRGRVSCSRRKWAARSAWLISTPLIAASIIGTTPVVAQLAVEFLPALLGEEDSGTVEANVPPHPGYGRRQPVAPLHVEVDVVRAPTDERRHMELLQPPLDGDRVGWVERGQEAFEIAGALRGSEMGREVGVDRFIRHAVRALIGRP